ncbi:hypothetical protein HYDPIDRAFT_135637 [Hydnomerulius pinastri MD-312]|uniref:NudC domain-containing protein 1 n=1 Tax=Hydnomerulius pinastri MD-312 TaxID=994086 RepID=A0A0C9VWL8_9AGAM|nr:hypothetical protein HYDPIDRAFT_135637 [Hydnomerulius pinastri MD-312]
MADFTPNRSLLNPKFEGYKLQLLSQDNVFRYNLQYKPTQAATSGRSPLSFQEVQSRITHNHLALSPKKGRGLYVDANHQVVVVDVADAGTDPSFNAVYELPTSVSAPEVDSVHREYASAAFLDESIAFVGDGQGTLYILDIPQAGPATFLASFDLVDKESATANASIPFRIHNVVKTSDSTAIALLSSRHYDAAAVPSQNHPVKHHEFDVWAAQFTLPFPEMKVDAAALDILWRRRGEDVPMLMAYDPTRKAYLILGSSTYRDVNGPRATPYEPSPDEIAPIPREGENLDTQPTKPHPYSWNQSPDVVTLAFPLPSPTQTSQIKVTFSQKTLTVHIQGSPSTIEGIPLPRYSAKQLWDGIRPSTSFWTWDREGTHKFGILTLHLDKQNEGTKWMHVFASSGTQSTDPSDVDVPETLDPSELYAIRESLEKYTAALKEGEDASGLGLGRGLPTLAQGEIDEEVDSEVGRVAFVTWVAGDGSVPAWCAGQRATDSAFNLLSAPLPGAEDGSLSLVAKNGIDGTRHVLEGGSAADDERPAWKHDRTFSALAFVLASKRDTRFTYHTPNAVFAFENGQDRGGNVYIYRSSNPKELWAKQSVLGVGDVFGGSLLGVGAFKADEEGEESHTIICLCEKELVVLRNVH